MIFGKKNDDDGQSLTQPIPPGWRVVDLGLLGSGGMSRVYRVRDETLGREIALKVLRPDLLKEPRALDRFIDEARITAQLDHPNIPPVYALAAEKKTTCFTMKVLEGVNLNQMLEDQRNVGIEALFAALEVMVRVCDAISFAHARGILHLDLKPQNVVVGEYGQIYVVDWGLSRRKADLPTEQGADHSTFGTPAYMAPEQAQGRNDALDERTDVFLLGGMIYKILTGFPPYVATTSDAVLELARHAKIVPPEKMAPKGRTLPRRLVAICLRALAIDPAQRYQDVAELKRDLEDFNRGTALLPELQLQAGAVIIREGDPGDCAYVILDGHCQATRTIAGRSEMLRLLGPGEMFGEAAVLTGSPRLATVTALVDTTVAVVDRLFLQEEMERSSFMALAIRTVAASVLDLNGQTAALLLEKSYADAVELAFRALALEGRPLSVDGSAARWVPWSALLARIASQTGLHPDSIAERVGRRPGLRVDPSADRLVLSPKV